VQNEAGAVAKNRAELREHLAAGRLRPYVGKRFPLEEAPAALAAVLRRQALGKVVVEVRGAP
jgi:NADPH:quinone reductase-like Zn-dependent oxidoreductase